MPGMVRNRTQVFRFAANIILMGMIKSLGMFHIWAPGGQPSLLLGSRWQSRYLLVVTCHLWKTLELS